MGAASSLSSQCLDFVDETEARRLCGDAWDEARWREAAPNGLVPRAQFVAAVPRAELPYHGRAILAESLTNDGGSGDAEGYSDDEFEYSLSDFEELDIDKKVSFARSGELARVVHTRTMTAPEDVPELFWDQRELTSCTGRIGTTRQTAPTLVETAMATLVVVVVARSNTTRTTSRSSRVLVSHGPGRRWRRATVAALMFAHVSRLHNNHRQSIIINHQAIDIQKAHFTLQEVRSDE